MKSEFDDVLFDGGIIVFQIIICLVAVRILLYNSPLRSLTCLDEILRQRFLKFPNCRDISTICE
jgi:hypothetical protein